LTFTLTPPLARNANMPSALLFYSNAPPPTSTHTLSLHDALPILVATTCAPLTSLLNPKLPLTCTNPAMSACRLITVTTAKGAPRSEEHTSELQSRRETVCSLLLEI